MACASTSEHTDAPAHAREPTPAGHAKAGVVGLTFAVIMERHKPDPWGSGHLQLYLLAALCFLNSTMSGNAASVHVVSLR